MGPLQPVLAGQAAGAGLSCLACADLDTTDDERSMGKLPSHYLLIARTPRPIARLTDNPRWTVLV